MSKKIAVTKTDNDQHEVGVQLRDDTPVTQKEGRLYINRNTLEMKGHINGKDVHLSFNQYENDPINPLDKQAWINISENKLKWKYEGLVKGVNLDNTLNSSQRKSSNHYLSILNEEELSQLADISTNYNTYMIDAFNNKNDSELENLVESNSALRVVDGQTSGTYKAEKKQSTGVNNAEGTVVYASQPLRPQSITDNGNGTFTIYFYNDLTDYLKDNQRVMSYELEDDKGLFLLDGDLDPAIFELASVSYDPTNHNTVVIIDGNGLDLAYGGKDVEHIRFKPLNIKVEASGKGTDATMSELKFIEAELLDSLSVMLGKQESHKLDAGLEQERHFRAKIKCSNNRKYWVILSVIKSVEIGSLAGRVYMWYSDDGLKSIKFVKDWNHLLADVTSDVTLSDSFTAYPYSNFILSNKSLFINDDGRYFVPLHIYNAKSIHAYVGYFGDLSGDPTPIKFNNSWGSYQGHLAWRSDISHHDADFVVDFEENIVFTQLTYVTGNIMYLLMNEIDFANRNTYARGHIQLGTNYRQPYFTNTMFIKTFEGEKQLVFINHHNNDYLYMHKFRYKRFYEESDQGLISIGQRGLTTRVNTERSPIDGDRYMGSAFSNNLEGGDDRYTYSSAIQHSEGYADRHVLDLGWDEEDDTLIMLISDLSEDILFLYGINFGRTTYGQTNNTQITFDKVPDTGNFTLSVYDKDSGITETTSPVAFSGSAENVKSVLEALTFINSTQKVINNIDYSSVIVTGDFETGFEINFGPDMRKVINITLNSNSLKESGNEVVITVNELNEGEKPVWLRYKTQSSNTQAYNKADGLNRLLEVNTNTNIDYAFGAMRYSESNMQKFLGTSMVVKNKSVNFSLPIAINNNSNLPNSVYVKIPDYTEFFGASRTGEQPIDGVNSRRSSAGTEIRMFMMHKSKSDEDQDYANNFVQRWHTGSDTLGLYPDGKMPLRTMQLYMDLGFTYSVDNLARRMDRPEYKVGIVVYPVGANDRPNFDNPIAYSKKRSVSNLPTAAQRCWTPFIFDNVLLDQNQDYFFGLAYEGFDFFDDEAEIDQRVSNFAISGASRTNVNECYFLQSNGEWVNVQRKIWFKWSDYYFGHTVEMHESGTNPLVRRMGNVAWLNSRQIIDTSLVERQDGKFLGTYREMGYPVDDVTNYSSIHGGSKAFSYIVEDTLGKYRPPLIRDAKLLGAGDNHDPHLVISTVFGYDHPRTRQTADNVPWYQYPSSTSDDYSRNRCDLVGGHVVDYDASLQRRADYAGTTHGSVPDSDFRYGWAMHGNAQGGAYIRNGPIDFTPYQWDFVTEIEYKIDERDLVHANYVMLISSFKNFRLHLHKDKLRVYTYNNSSEVLVFDTYESFEANKYYRFRVNRSYDEGLNIWYNTSNQGGEWVKCRLDTTNANDGEIMKHGLCMGTQDVNNINYLCIGRYTSNGNYNFYGKIGYFKLAIGSSEFAYDGINFDQQPVYELQNTGEVILAERAYNLGKTPIHTSAIAEKVILRHEEGSKTALVSGPHTALKVKGNVEAGRYLATQITLDKVSDSDPSAVEGYAISFNKD